MITIPQDIDWFDRVLAVLFATVAVLGTVTVATTVVLLLLGADGAGIPAP